MKSRTLALAVVLAPAVVGAGSAGAQTFSVLLRFTGSGGANPQAGLIRDASGNLYGTTSGGGAHGLGTVFKLDATGKETVVHSFSGPDGENPAAALIRDASGNLYGTSVAGGKTCLVNSPSSCGTVFKLIP